MNTMHLMIAILGTGISLAGLLIGLIVWLRADMKDLRTDMRSMEERLQENIHNLQQEVTDIREDIAALRERMAHLEGLLQGLREAITMRTAA